MTDKMETPKFREEYVGVNLAEVEKCMRAPLETFCRMAGQLAYYGDFCRELLRLSPIEVEERGIDMLEAMANAICLDLLAESLRKNFKDLFTKFDDLRDIGKAEESAKMIDFAFRLRYVNLLENFFNPYFDAKDSYRIKMLRGLRGNKKKTKPESEKREKGG